MQQSIDEIVVFLIVFSTLTLAVIIFIFTLFYFYKKKQLRFIKNLDKIKLDHEKNLLSSQLEIQEQTFQSISREIHDNISLSLTLAKLHLNTLDITRQEQASVKIEAVIELLGQSIHDLSDISKSLNADIIIQNGLIKALEKEIERIQQIGLLSIRSVLTGNPVYLDGQKELIIFRIIQESFNNIIKHAGASHSQLTLDYNPDSLHILITDNGKGFEPAQVVPKQRAGLRNMNARINMLKGVMNINSKPGFGTALSFKIPLE